MNPDRQQGLRSYGYLGAVFATLIIGPLPVAFIFHYIGAMAVGWIVPLVVALLVDMLGGNKKLATFAGLASAGTIWLLDLMFMLGGLDCASNSGFAWLLPSDCAENGSSLVQGLIALNLIIVIGFIVAARAQTSRKRI